MESESNDCKEEGGTADRKERKEEEDNEDKSKEKGKKGDKQGAAGREGRTFPTPLSRDDSIAANILLFSS